MEPLKSEWLSYSWPYCDKGKLIAGIFAKSREADFEVHIFSLPFILHVRKLPNSRQEEDHHCNYGAQTYHHDRRTREVCQQHTYKDWCKKQEIPSSAHSDLPVNVSAIKPQIAIKRPYSIREFFFASAYALLWMHSYSRKAVEEFFWITNILNSRESVSANAV